VERRAFVAVGSAVGNDLDLLIFRKNETGGVSLSAGGGHFDVS
jgi:hypothetical protein